MRRHDIIVTGKAPPMTKSKGPKRLDANDGRLYFHACAFVLPGLLVKTLTKSNTYMIPAIAESAPTSYNRRSSYQKKLERMARKGLDGARSPRASPRQTKAKAITLAL